MRLLRVELLRFRSRRAVSLLLLAAVLLTAFLAAATLWDTRPVGAAEMQRAQAMAQRQLSSPDFHRELKRCQKHPENYAGPDATAEQCAEMMTPRPEWFLDRRPLSLAEVQQDTGLASLLLVAGIMLVIGATFAGADWASGSMSNQLLFEPRRGRVWLAKAAAVTLGTAAAAAVTAVLFWAAMFGFAHARGISTPAAVQAHIGAMVGRGVVLAAAAALGAYALTMLLRHTVGTLAVLVAYGAGGAALIAALPFAGVGRWDIGNNLFAWLRNGTQFYDDSLPCRRNACDQMVHLSLAHGAGYLGLLLAIVMAASVLLFRRRDLT